MTAGRLRDLAGSCDVAEIVAETQVKTLVLDAPDWPGHLAGQHVDIRLTAEDGYQAQRSYSIASAPERAASPSPWSGWPTARSRPT